MKFLTWWMWMMPWWMWAQVEFTARTDKQELSTEDRLKVEFTLNERPDDFQAPSFEGFRVVMGPFRSTSFQYINGKSSYSYTFGYVLQPLRTGTLVIGSAAATVNGKTYRTEPIRIKVLKPTPGFSMKGPATDKKSENGNGADVFFRLELNKREAYTGEAIGGVYKLYVRQGVEVADLQQLSLPEYEGFWKEIVSDKVEGPAQTQINGQNYLVYTLGKVVLFPQRTGILKIKPYKISIVKLRREKRYFGPFVEYVDVPEQISLSTKTQHIRVKPLPEAGKPDSFTGAVGVFDLEAEAGKLQVRTGDAVTLELRLSGTGNFNQFELPKWQLSDGLEVYEPEKHSNLRATLYGLKGYESLTYTIIPQAPGKYKIPALKWAYFNPQTKKYEEISTREMILEVKGKALTGGTPVSPGVSGGAGDTYFHYIAGKTRLVPMDKKAFYPSGGFYTLLLILLAFFPLAFGIKKYREYVLSDTEKLQQKTVKKHIRNLLKEAEKHVGDKDVFYGHLEKALVSYLQNALKISAVQMHKTAITEALKKRGVPGVLTDRLNALWEKIETVRYTPVDIRGMEKDFEEAKQLLGELDKYLSK